MKADKNEQLPTKKNAAALWLGFEKVYAFVKRGFVIMVSYKLNFALTLAAMVTQALSFYFIGKLLGGAVSSYLAPYGGDYTNFVIWGIAFQGFIVSSLTSFSGEIRREQLMGTLELVLLSPTRLITILFCSSVWNYLFASIYALATITIAAAFLGLELVSANIMSAILMLALTVLSTMGIGMISAGVILVTKAGDPIAWVFSTLTILLSGVYYPIEVLPQGIRSLSSALPLTYGLEGMRLALMRGAELDVLIDKVAILSVFTLITWALGYLVFNLGFRKARADGSLAQY